MQTELSARVGVYDNSNATDLVKLKRWLNMAQQEISSKYNWPFMIAEEIVQTVTDITTGTASVSAGGTTVTLTSGPAASCTNRFIKFSDANDWYQITAHTAASTTMTITPAYAGTSNLSASTFTIRKLWYTTAAALDSILDIKQFTVPGRVCSLPPGKTDMFAPLYYDTGNPYQYILSVPTSTGALQFSLFYSPSTVQNLMVRGIKQLSDMSATTDVSVIPTRWQGGLIDLASYYAFLSVDESRAKQCYERAMIAVEDMKRVYIPDTGRQRILQPTDGMQGGDVAYSLPPEYGEQ